MLADPVARRYVSGVAWHCYEGDVPAQSPVHDAFPDKDAWFTECSGGEWSPKFAEVLGWMTDKLIIGACQQLVARVAAVEPRARSGARAAQGRLRRLPRRRDDRSGDRRDHPQRRILCARPRQPVRLAGRLPRRRDKRGEGIEAAAFLNRDGSRVAILHRNVRRRSCDDRARTACAIGCRFLPGRSRRFAGAGASSR